MNERHTPAPSRRRSRPHPLVETDIVEAETLSGLDASFLHVETTAAPMHTLKVLVFELPRDTSDVRATLIRRIEAQLDALLALRVRVRVGPFGRVAWEAVDVDVQAHVAHRVLHGGSRERAWALGELMSRPLPRHRPLWEVLALEDRRQRKLTVAIKIHHALADGKAAATMLEIAAGVASSGPARLACAPPSSARTAAALVRAAMRAAASVPLAFLQALLQAIFHTSRGLVRSALVARSLGARAVRPFSGAPTSFTGPVTAARRVAVASLCLAEIVRIKAVAGVTVNDVVLAVTAGALRRYLTRRGERTERPLTAAMPVGVGDSPYSLGNQLSTVLVPIHVDEHEPWARLLATSVSASHAKALHAARGADLLMRWTELAPRALQRAIWALVRLSKRAPVDLVVSNVRGPRERLEIGGATLESIYSVGPLLETTGLNVTFWSYAGRLHVCVLACADHGSDPQAIVEDLSEALDELSACLRPSRLAA